MMNSAWRKLAPAVVSLTLGATLLSYPASAQRAASTPPDAYARAIAAGYKAAMLCSGMFNAGRTRAQVEAEELTGIYPDYQALVATLPASIDRAAGTVVVDSGAPGMPPRIAVWRRGRGCTNLPIGTDAGTPRGDPAPALAGADPRPWPMGDAGIAPRPSRALAATIARALDGTSYGAGTRTAGVVVVQDGRVVAERYAAGWGPFVSNRTWSVAKSIAGTLVGVAVSEQSGLRTATLSQWRTPSDPRQAVRLDHLLRMASGLHSDTAGNRTDALYFGGTAVDEQAPGWPLEAAPGTRFRYANNDTLLAVLLMRQTLGERRYRELPNAFFAQLGMTHTVAEEDWRGNFILSSQVWSTPRDLARLGQFWLQDGVWAGKRLLPEGWVRYMAAPAGPQPADGPGYGATLWLFGERQKLPAGSYAAQGNRGQYVMVVPSERLVIVRRGEDPTGARFDIAAFIADVVNASR